MAEKLDLLKIAQEEQNGDLFKLLDRHLQAIQGPAARLSSDAIIWEGGNQPAASSRSRTRSPTCSRSTAR